jgi:hypothetical protein
MSQPPRYGALGPHLPLIMRLAPITQFGGEIAVDPAHCFPVRVWWKRGGVTEYYHFSDPMSLASWVDEQERYWRDVVDLNSEVSDDD